MTSFDTRSKGCFLLYKDDTVISHSADKCPAIKLRQRNFGFTNTAQKNRSALRTLFDLKSIYISVQLFLLTSSYSC